MTQEKVEQNALIVELRDTKGWSWGQILDELTRKGLTGLSGPASVKMKYYAVKNRQLASKDEKVTSTPTVTPEALRKLASERKERVTSPSTSTKRMTFWLPVDMIETIKGMAAKEKRTASAILRGVLGKYLKNK